MADFWAGLVEGRSVIAPLVGIEDDLKRVSSPNLGATVNS
jgi:hypothetical protein